MSAAGGPLISRVANTLVLFEAMPVLSVDAMYLKSDQLPRASYLRKISPPRFMRDTTPMAGEIGSPQ